MLKHTILMFIVGLVTACQLSYAMELDTYVMMEGNEKDERESLGFRIKQTFDEFDLIGLPEEYLKDSEDSDNSDPYVKTIQNWLLAVKDYMIDEGDKIVGDEKVSIHQLRQVLTLFADCCEKTKIVFDIDLLIKDLLRLLSPNPTNDFDFLIGWGSFLRAKLLEKLDGEEICAWKAILKHGMPSEKHYKPHVQTFNLKRLQEIKMRLTTAVNRLCLEYVNQ